MNAGLPALHDDLRRDIDRQDYVEAKLRFEGLCTDAGIPVEAVGYFGEISFPGISDIDALVIAEPDALKRLDSAFAVEREKNKSFAELFWHPPVYVLPGMVDHLLGLHTLEGLKMNRPASFGEGYFAHELRGVLLHLIWFTFLQFNVGSVLRQKATSLRLILMLQKNLEHTRRYFAKLNASEPDIDHLGHPLMASDVLRNRVWNQPQYASSPEIPRLFEAQFHAAAKTVDAYCEAHGDGPLIKDGAAGLGRSVFTRRAIAIRSSVRGSRFVRFNRFVLALTNPLCFSLACHFVAKLRPVADADDAMSSYLRTTNIAWDAYHAGGLNYPFVTPFGLPGGGGELDRLRVRARWMRWP